jgi:two-component system phosphate regulon sensor histidine kinase PhoR
MRRLSFRVRLFLALSAVAVAALGLAAVLTARELGRTTVARIERGLVSETRLAAELLSTGLPGAGGDALDAEADRLGAFVDARVTFIRADGIVVGDSAEDGEALRALENHRDRPEVVDARARGLGMSRRYSTTVDADMLYVAAPTTHPSIAVVRFALPLTEVGAQVRVVWQATGVALAIALVPAVGLAWLASSVLSTRLQQVAAAARRYAAGDVSRPSGDYGNDEIGQLGRTLDDSARELARRMADLDHARSRTEAILSGMVEGVMVVDADGRLQIVNASARQMLGVPAPDREHAGGQRYLHVIRHPGIVSQFDAALSGTAPDDHEIVLPSGATVIARAVPLAPGGAVLVLHDITRLRQADQMRRDFVANVSHELRTPLTAIRGYAEALRDDTLPAAERERFLATIDRHTGRMTRLVQDLLRLARLESGQEPVALAEVDLAALCPSVAADFRTRLDARKQRLEIRIAPGAESIVTDAAKLEEILRNLIDNASVYAPPGTEIRLEAARGDGDLVIRVQDQGPGIPAADLTRVFERFYRVDPARSRESGGTGLGLSIVRHLADRLGGRVAAANRPGGGAEFVLTLPGPPPVTQI